MSFPLHRSTPLTHFPSPDVAGLSDDNQGNQIEESDAGGGVYTSVTTSRVSNSQNTDSNGSKLGQGACQTRNLEALNTFVGLVSDVNCIHNFVLSSRKY